MSRIDRFEDLIAWQKARELARQIYAVTREGALARDFGLSGQMQRSAVSVMANIAEGFERGGRGEFHQFVCTAKASCAEVRSHLYIALDAGYLERQQFQHLLAHAEEVARILGGLRSSLEQQRKAQDSATKPNPAKPTQSSVLSTQS